MYTEILALFIAGDRSTALYRAEAELSRDEFFRFLAAIDAMED